MPFDTRARPIPPRASAVQQRTTTGPEYDDEYEDQYDDRSARLPTSVRRYDRYPAMRPPPVEPPPQRRRRGGVMPIILVLLCLFVGGALAVTVPPAVQHWRDNATYGFPRTFQISEAVGHGDPHSPDSHFIALNLRGVLEVIEIPGGDPGTYPPQMYRIATLTGSGADLVPLTVSFSDVNGDGKPDLIASYDGIETILFNNGKSFVAKL